MKRLLHALQDNVAKYEAQFGKIDVSGPLPRRWDATLERESAILPECDRVAVPGVRFWDPDAPASEPKAPGTRPASAPADAPA